MKVVIQKSGPASVTVDGKVHAEIKRGLVILLGITNDDKKDDIEYLVEKISNLRLFEEAEKHFEKSIIDAKEEALVISQFTLYAGVKNGRRPDFTQAAKPEIAKPIYNEFVARLRAKGLEVQTGEFGAMMEVKLINEGPVTIIIDSKT